VKRKNVFEKLYKKTVLGVYRAIHSIKVWNILQVWSFRQCLTTTLLKPRNMHVKHSIKRLFLQLRGKYLMGGEQVQLVYQNTLKTRERDRTIGTMKFERNFECFLNRRLVWIESVNFASLSINMNGIYECFLYCLLVWMESLHVFVIVCQC
jgi:hypothetical protein